MQTNETIDRQTVNQLFAELGVRFPDERLFSKLTHHNDHTHFEFIQSYLNETRGPTHREYQMNLLNLWSLNKLNDRVVYASEVVPHSFLMVGIPKDKLYKTLQSGHFPLASDKAVFGNKGFYFTSCSTKAANRGTLDSWNYERYADQGIYQPKNMDIGYIMFCDIALGKCLHRETRHKNGILPFMNCDSLVFSGLYDLTGVESVIVTSPRMSNYQLDIPRAPFFRDRSIQKISAKSTDYFDYNDYYVQNLEQIRPRFLAQIRYEDVV